MPGEGISSTPASRTRLARPRSTTITRSRSESAKEKATSVGNATRLAPEGNGSRPDASRTRRLFCEGKGHRPGEVERVASLQR